MPLNEDEIARQARATWDRDEETRAEFIKFENYRAFAIAEAKGLVRIFGRGVDSNASRDTPAVGDAGQQAILDHVTYIGAQNKWTTDSAIRSEFVCFEHYVAYLRAARDGRIKILGQPNNGSK